MQGGGCGFAYELMREKLREGCQLGLNIQVVRLRGGGVGSISLTPGLTRVGGQIAPCSIVCDPRAMKILRKSSHRQHTHTKYTPHPPSNNTHPGFPYSYT